MTLVRQTYSTKELHEMTGWSYSTIYRKVRRGKLVVLAHDEGDGVRGDGFRFPIVAFHEAYPELRIPFQLELPMMHAAPRRPAAATGPQRVAVRA